MKKDTSKRSNGTPRAEEERSPKENLETTIRKELEALDCSLAEADTKVRGRTEWRYLIAPPPIWSNRL